MSVRARVLTCLRAVPQPLVLAVGVLSLGVAAGWAGESPRPDRAGVVVATLPAVNALPATRVDTLFMGGYARGSFRDALATLASDLSTSEREMVGRHLDKIFASVLPPGGMGAGGRLRLAYERTRRPDGSTRSVQVLAAEAAVGGQIHRVFVYERGDVPGYFNDLGRSLDPAGWAKPLATMRVTSGFGKTRLHPILGRVLPHLGLDLAATKGTPIRATADGVVSWAGPRGGYGNLVELSHPSGYTTRYAHMSAVAPGLAPGMPVRQGDVVGYVGMTGLATGPHLHYEVRRKGQPVDPATAATLADAGPVRDVGYSSGWFAQRRRLDALLARVPRILNIRSSAM